jgi:hypothetical protein
MKWLLFLPLIACDTVSGDVAALKEERTSLTAEVATLHTTDDQLTIRRDELQGQVAALNKNAAVLSALSLGKHVRYILHCSIRQVHYSLSIAKQVADAVNEEQFDLVTDKDSYDLAQPDTDLFNSFRGGSAVLKGSLGSWRIKVVSKHTQEEK